MATKSVLHLISSSAFLGAERVTCELASHVDPARFCCAVGVLGSPPLVLDCFRDALGHLEVPVIHFPCPVRWSGGTVASIAHYLQSRRIDIVHSHGYKSDFYAQAALRSAGNVVPFATNHNWITGSLAERIYRLIDLQMLKRCRSVVAVSEELKAKMAAAGILPDRIRVIDNGISLRDPWSADEVAACRARLGIPGRSLVVGSVAGLTPVKAHAELLHAFARLQESVADSLLLLVGDGPERAPLEKLAQELMIGEKTRFLGFRPDARELLAAFDLFALVSHSEGLPMAMLEAMGASLPVVVSAVGAIPSVVRSGENGLLVTPGDVRGIADALHLLGTKEELRRRLGERARRDVADRHSVQRMAREYGLLYQEVLEQRR